MSITPIYRVPKPIHEVVDGMKVCLKCKENKPVSEFYRRFKYSSNLKANCKKCENERKN